MSHLRKNLADRAAKEYMKTAEIITKELTLKKSAKSDCL